MQKKPNDFGQKYGNQTKHNENAECINNITRELEGREDGPKTEMHIDLHKKRLKRLSNWKTSAMMEYMASGSRNSPPFTAD